MIAPYVKEGTNLEPPTFEKDFLETLERGYEPLEEGVEETNIVELATWVANANRFAEDAARTRK